MLNRRTVVAGGLGLLAGSFPGGEEIGLSRAVAAGDHSVTMTTSADYADAVAVLRDQWHDLVRADNLLGPRAALGLVRQQITVVESLLPAVRGGLRTDLVSLAAQYAESAAWLFEDSGGARRGTAMDQSRNRMGLRGRRQNHARVDDVPPIATSHR